MTRYRFKSDKHQWTVQEFVPENPDKPRKDPSMEKWRDCSYHLTLGHASQWLLDKLLKDGGREGVEDTRTLILALDRAKDQVRDCVASALAPSPSKGSTGP